MSEYSFFFFASRALYGFAQYILILQSSFLLFKLRLTWINLSCCVWLRIKATPWWRQQPFWRPSYHPYVFIYSCKIILAPPPSKGIPQATKKENKNRKITLYQCIMFRSCRSCLIVYKWWNLLCVFTYGWLFSFSHCHTVCVWCIAYIVFHASGKGVAYFLFTVFLQFK